MAHSVGTCRKQVSSKRKSALRLQCCKHYKRCGHKCRTRSAHPFSGGNTVLLSCDMMCGICGWGHLSVLNCIHQSSIYGIRVCQQIIKMANCTVHKEIFNRGPQQLAICGTSALPSFSAVQNHFHCMLAMVAFRASHGYQTSPSWGMVPYVSLAVP